VYIQINSYFPWSLDLADLADFFSVVFVIVRKMFVWKTILGKSIGKVGNLDSKNTTVTQSALQKIN